MKRVRRFEAGWETDVPSPRPSQQFAAIFTGSGKLAWKMVKNLFPPEEHEKGQQHLLEEVPGRTAGRRIRARQRRRRPAPWSRSPAPIPTPIAATTGCAPSADLLVEILAERGGQGLIVGAPAVSDALTQGTPTAGYSLVSRDVVADCFEIGHYAHHGDAMIVISGCDKTGAAALMPLARTNAFGLVLYPGTSSPGRVVVRRVGRARATTSPSWITPRAAPPTKPAASRARSCSSSSATSCRAAAPAARCSPPTR